MTFGKCENEALGKKVDDLKAQGWIDVVVLNKGRYFAKWDHVARSKKDGRKVYVEWQDNGEPPKTSISRTEMTQPLQIYF